MALLSAPPPERLDDGPGVGLAVGALVLAGQRVGTDLLLVRVHRANHRQRLGHRLGLGVFRPFKGSPGMCPTQSVGHLVGALRGIGRVRLVAVAE